MKVTPTPPLRIALLTWLLDGDEPLAGDLMEECVHRPRSWFWWQLIFAVVGRTATGAVAYLRQPSRLEEHLASVAVLGILCFQVVVVGSLLSVLLPEIRIERPEWLTFGLLLSLPVAWAIGKAVSHVRSKHRIATVVLYGASAAVAALTTNAMLTSSGAVLFRAVGVQAGAAAVFVVGLLAGAASADSSNRESGLGSNEMSISE